MTESRFARTFTAVLAVLIVSLPMQASAAGIFGGKVGASIPCFNIAIWAQVGAPRGGVYIWTPATRTYPDGPPASGKWILGLSGIPYFCIVWIAPLFPIPGISITMMGSS